MKTEKRVQNLQKIEVRKLESGQRYFEGYAAVFDQDSKLMTEGGRIFYETIERGAFDKVLQTDPDVVLTINHDKSKLLARTKSGTLTLFVDDVGLRYKATVPNTTDGNDAYEMVSRGDLYESSFKFGLRPSKDATWNMDANKKVWKRSVSNIPLIKDVAIVTEGAYANTDVTVAERNLQDFEHKKAARQIRINKLKLLEL